MANQILRKVFAIVCDFLHVFGLMAHSNLQHITIPKQSLRQGNVFTPVCPFTSVRREGVSVRREGVSVRREGVFIKREGSPLGEESLSVDSLPDPPSHGRRAGSTHPTGMLSCYAILIAITGAIAIVIVNRQSQTWVHNLLCNQMVIAFAIV